MFEDCCPECGHLLSKNRSVCPFCGWDENLDQYSYAFKVEDDLLHSEPSELYPDQLPGF